MADSLTILANINDIITSNGTGSITADNLRAIADELLDVDIRATGTITDNINSPSVGTISGDFFMRKFYDLNSLVTIDYENRRLYRADGTYFDWEDDSGGGSGTVTSIQFTASSSLIDFSGSTPAPAASAVTITTSGSVVMNLKSSAIQYSHIQNVSAAKLLGRYASSSGLVQEISLDSTNMGFIDGFDISGNPYSQLAVISINSDTVFAVRGLRADIVFSGTFTTASTRGNFIVKRVIYTIKGSITPTGGPTSPGECTISWVISGTTYQLATQNNMYIPTASPNMVQWTDMINGTALSSSPNIPPNTVVSVKTATACVGYGPLFYAVYVIGFYES